MLQSDLIDLSVNFHALTDPQLLQVALELWLLLQHLQQVGGLHALQLHFVVDVDFVVEADVNQAGSVLPILTGILTCRKTKNQPTIQSVTGILMNCDSCMQQTEKAIYFHRG